jgi:23S rRNA (cytidine1920-2'-O)/16S rRNA (cytidine1409-2'-O)-methyltransferase
MAKKDRADHVLVTLGLTESREQAKRLIMAGRVSVLAGDRRLRVEKPGQQLFSDARLDIAEAERFVSRGGYKLLTALEYFTLKVDGLVALDAGASTGGFTDCLLQYGAAKVYAVDVGKHQLHERLRGDLRVVSLEGVNLRTAPADLIPEKVDLIVADLSFISLTLVLAACMQWLKPGGLTAALIKPQFELGPGGTDKGVVRDEALRKQAVDKVLAFARSALKLSLLGVVPSAIRGAKGNQEYMAVWRN